MTTYSAKDPAADRKLQLQLAIFEVVQDSDGKSFNEIREMLLSAFKARGVASPPGTWLDSVASSAFYGEPYIIDLTAAVAADTTLPAPTEDVRQGLESRRHLRHLKLPPGIFPSEADWDVPVGQDAAGRPGAPQQPRAGARKTVGTRIAMVVTALATAAFITTLAVRASHRRVTDSPGSGGIQTREVQ